MLRFKLEIDVKDDSPHGVVSLTIWGKRVEKLVDTTTKVCIQDDLDSEEPGAGAGSGSKDNENEEYDR
nr:hypothetical protein [Tanacetum cinerariifolium]